MEAPDTREWLEADGLGGFASGTVSGIRTRRYHALLLTATAPPTGRMVLVNGIEVWLETEGRIVPLSSQHYAPDAIHPDGYQRIEAFDADPWPRWRYGVAGGATIVHEIVAEHGRPAVGLTWRLDGPWPKREPLTLCVRPLLSGRDYHALHRENPAFVFEPLEESHQQTLRRLVWRPYAGVPSIIVRTNGRYQHEPLWYRNFLYRAEQERGLDCLEDLASPGTFRWDLTAGDALWLLAADTGSPRRAERVRTTWPPDAERRRRAGFVSALRRAADAYLVRRGSGTTIIAGYPWFTDWGRDTFIALRGLCLATGRLDDARDILLGWAGTVSDGMLPNRFPDRGAVPEYNSVDASLWYVVAVHDYLAACANAQSTVPAADRARLHEAVGAILHGYTKGTRFGIRMDTDGLLAAGEAGMQLTWMDAKAGDWVATPRIGKPVEVQALWLTALRIAVALKLPGDRWKAAFDRGRQTFLQRFWNETDGGLHDVIDCDHHAGTFDASFRPNQIFSVGGLPWPLLDGVHARQLVEAVERRLWTPLGLRTLAADDPRYIGRYEGGVIARDGGYHQGTAWPWLLGPFVEAWVRTRGGTATAKRQARERFVAPLLAHLDEAGLGHVSEIVDGDAPHIPRGCPFQAWSVGELLRLQLDVLR
ncbi:MAG TPA: amylo-alpha-1,6-glucosidase [Nitrospirales bacterium]|nr:amylo-alpha-1,6-glucosidase [Nitrospirales bacterium]